MNLETISDVKSLDVFTLNKEFGRKSGTYIYNAVRGIDAEPVKKENQEYNLAKL